MDLFKQIGALDIYRESYEFLDSNMYLFVEGTSALVVDPHDSEEALCILTERGIRQLDIMLTHEHTDHISGLYFFQERFNTKTICHENCANRLKDKRLMRPILTSFILGEQDAINGTHLLDRFRKTYIIRTYKADLTFCEYLDYNWSRHNFRLTSIPGHSSGSICIQMDDKLLITGDSLFKDTCVITSFPQGDRKVYFEKTIPFFESLDFELLVCPGHGEAFNLKAIIINNKINVSIR